MKSILTATAAGLALTIGLLATPAHAQNNNDFMSQAKRFFGNNSDEQNAYVRGRQDEMRAEQNMRYSNQDRNPQYDQRYGSQPQPNYSDQYGNNNGYNRGD